MDTIYEVVIPGGREGSRVYRFVDAAVARGFAAAQRFAGRRVTLRQRTISIGGPEPSPPSPKRAA
jgi:hypothetical protein